MRIILVLLILFFLVIKSYCQKVVDFKLKNGLEIEVFDHPDSLEKNIFDSDNRIFVEDNIHLFDYHLEKNGKKLKFNSFGWEHASCDTDDSTMISYVKISIQPEVDLITNAMNPNLEKTILLFEFLGQDRNSILPIYKTYSVENDRNIYVGFPVPGNFQILMLSPPILLKSELNEILKYEYAEKVNKGFSDPYWKEFDRSYVNRVKYTSEFIPNYETQIGLKSVYFVNGIGESEHGRTEINCVFDYENGIYLIEFLNIDKSKLVFRRIFN